MTNTKRVWTERTLQREVKNVAEIHEAMHSRREVKQNKGIEQTKIDRPFKMDNGDVQISIKVKLQRTH